MRIAMLAGLAGIAVGSCLTLLARSDEPRMGRSRPPLQALARTPEAILRAFADDFRHDPAAEVPRTFGVRVTGEGGGVWHVSVSGRRNADETWEVALAEGLPPAPVVGYVTDVDTLRRIDAGDLNALTAMAKARSSDRAPMDLDVPEGFTADSATMAGIIPATFHFWTRGRPEVVRFGDRRHTREVHGGLATVFYYQQGFRSAWYRIEPGQHVNQAADDQTNPFPTLVIMTAGTLEARFGGRQMQVSGGDAVFIPAGMTHEVWNAAPVAAEFVILMFGAGA